MKKMKDEVLTWKNEPMFSLNIFNQHLKLKLQLINLKMIRLTFFDWLNVG